jgi:hypothetical protein
MAYILKTLPQKYGYTENWDVVSALCSREDTELGLVASLVFQLIRSNKYRAQAVQSAYPVHDLVQNPSIGVRQLWMLLDASITECSNREVVILIDGLDELHNDYRTSFLTNFRVFETRVASTAGTRVLISSRAFADISDAFFNFPTIEPGKERRGMNSCNRNWERIDLHN